MGGKFRVKAKAAVSWKRRPFCAGTAAEAMNRCFSVPKEAFQIAQNSFYLADRL
jgi:hypothetical protein